MSDEPAYLLDLSAHGRIRATGDDRARLIHALSTNHIQQLKAGESAYAFFLTAQGRILADANILCFSDSLLIDVEPETRELIYKHIDHYIIADDVTLEDETEATFSFGIEGDAAGPLLERLGVPLPTRAAHCVWEGLTVAGISATGAPAYRVYGPLARKQELWERMLVAGAQPGELAPLRIAHFQPRYGEDFTEKTLPQETGLSKALHFQKGCYLGQEIVERIRSRAHINRILTGLLFEGGSAPEPGTAVMAGEAESGKITSSHGSHALAMVRVQHAEPDTKLTAGGVSAVTRPIHAT